MTLLGGIVTDLDAAYSVPLVRRGEQLGLDAALKTHGPLTSTAPADCTGCGQRCLSGWLANQTAGGYANDDEATDAQSPDAGQAMVSADPDSLVYILGAFDNAITGIENQPKAQAAFRTGAGVARGDQASCMVCAVAKSFRPGHSANLVANWLPALHGVVDRLRGGGRIADIGSGRGPSTSTMAAPFRDARVVGFAVHGPSIEEANAHAAQDRVKNLRVETASNKIPWAGGRRPAR